MKTDSISGYSKAVPSCSKLGGDLIEALGLNGLVVTDLIISLHAGRLVEVAVCTEVREEQFEKIIPILSQYNLVPKEAEPTETTLSLFGDD